MPTGKKCKDHLGNEYGSVAQMCKHYGISQPTYLCRINKGWSIEKALTNHINNGKIIYDHLGNKFKSISSMYA